MLDLTRIYITCWTLTKYTLVDAWYYVCVGVGSVVTVRVTRSAKAEVDESGEIDKLKAACSWAHGLAVVNLFSLFWFHLINIT